MTPKTVKFNMDLGEKNLFKDEETDKNTDGNSN